MLSLLAKIRKPLEKFEQTLIEANYHANPDTLWSFFSSRKKQELPETPTVAMSNTMLGLSKVLRNRFLWGAIFAMLATKALVVTSVVLGVAGSSLLAVEYMRARKAVNEEIVEVNFAGQKVAGRRSDLCRLHKAQQKILNIDKTFKKASTESTFDTIRDILDSVAQERSRITVMDGGPYGGSQKQYDFSRPKLYLVSEDGVPGKPASAANDSAPAAVSLLKPLRLEFSSAAERDTYIIEQMTTLHNMLSTEQRGRINEKILKMGS